MVHYTAALCGRIKTTTKTINHEENITHAQSFHVKSIKVHLMSYFQVSRHFVPADYIC